MRRSIVVLVALASVVAHAQSAPQGDDKSFDQLVDESKGAQPPRDAAPTASPKSLAEAEAIVQRQIDDISSRVVVGGTPAAPPELCERLERMREAGADAFMSVRGEMQGTSGAIFKSLLSLPDEKCFVDASNESDGTMRIACTQKPATDLTLEQAEAATMARADQVEACLGKDGWRRDRFGPKHWFAPNEPWMPRVEIETMTKPKNFVMTSVVVSPAPNLVSREFCAALGALVDGTPSQWANAPAGAALPGAQSCGVTRFEGKPAMHCKMRATNDKYAGRGWLQRSGDAVGACMQSTEWQVRGGLDAWSFTHPHPDAPTVKVWLSDLTGIDAQTRGDLPLYTVMVDVIAP